MDKRKYFERATSHFNSHKSTHMYAYVFNNNKITSVLVFVMRFLQLAQSVD